MNNYKIKYLNNFTTGLRLVKEKVVEQKMELLLRNYRERNIVLEFMTFYVENEYLWFSAGAKDEARIL